ncbi:hypothetical protein [Jiangella alkaliphila]|uniref:Alpha-lytic protease prodomain-containing protein n=1 Tax=Jiangella alkaliphila TaxID=419479 RepID=A0A1H2M0I7_9ACTN|nr:hypothetical protein [Jiangella alkaliphila]SDU86622.1 hypothetical protein SAMN04488563_6906 [Jiangella alkaliphila]
MRRSLPVLASVALVLAAAGAGAQAAEFEPDQVPEPAETFGEPITPVAAQYVNATFEALQATLEAAPDVYGGSYWHPRTESLRIQIRPGADSVQVAQLEREVDDVLAALAESSKVTFAVESESVVDGQAMAEDLGLDTAWAGAESQAVKGAYYDMSAATVKVLVDASAESRLEGALRGLRTAVPVRIEPVTEPGSGDAASDTVGSAAALLAGSRFNDRGGWTGGNLIRGSLTNFYCTQGFTWRLWSNNRLYGGIAEYCSDRDNSWLHAGRSVGAVGVVEPTVDAGLMGAASGTSYNADVWVGATNTADVRPVRSAAGSVVVGTHIAISGAYAGLDEGLITGPVYGPGWPNGLVRVTGIDCESDFGAPYLTTYSDGAVMAHGQAWQESDDDPDCYYVNVTAISSALNASIAVVP